MSWWPAGPRRVERRLTMTGRCWRLKRHRSTGPGPPCHRGWDGSINDLMKKLLIAMMLSGCVTNRAPSTSPPPTGPLPDTQPPLPSDGDIIIITKVGNAQATEAELLKEGVRSANKVLRSLCFRDKLLNRRLTSTRGRLNTAIYESLTSPRVELELYFFTGTRRQNYRYRTVGYFTGPNQIYMNRFFVKTAEQIADNLLHEAAHSRGYTHRSARESSSIPYTMNALFSACAPEASANRLFLSLPEGGPPYHPEE